MSSTEGESRHIVRDAGRNWRISFGRSVSNNGTARVEQKLDTFLFDMHPDPETADNGDIPNSGPAVGKFFLLSYKVMIQYSAN